MNNPKFIGNSTLWGIALAVVAFFCFPLHDAIVKWLVVDFAIWQILFVRSATSVTLALVMGGRRTLVRAVRSPARKILFLRAVITMCAWIAFYSAAKTLQLAELTTIYFSSPLLVALMAIPILGEKVSIKRWAALGIGFVGILIACHPENSSQTVALSLAAIAAVLWAYSMILMRQVGASEPTAVQMLVANSLIFVLCGLMMPFEWRLPGLMESALLLSVGVIGTVAQYFLFESARRAPAVIISSMEFTALIWAFAFGYLIFGDVPRPTVFVGAAVIALSGLIMVSTEWYAVRNRTEAENAENAKDR